MVPGETKIPVGLMLRTYILPSVALHQNPAWAVQMAKAQRSLFGWRPMPVDAEYLTGSSKTRMEVP